MAENNKQIEYDLHCEDPLDPYVPCEYTPARYRGHWVIKVTQPGAPRAWLIRCGEGQTEQSIWQRIRDLKLDDDNVDAQAGKARKYQG